MKITFEVDTHDHVMVAICYLISLDENCIHSKKSFKNEVFNYFELFGLSCIDDHQAENSNVWEKALAIYNEFCPFHLLDKAK